MTQSITTYKPLTEAVDFQDNSYFTEATPDQLNAALCKNERVHFTLSGEYVKSSNIKLCREAAPSDVIRAWKLSKLNGDERSLVRNSIEMYKSHTSKIPLENHVNAFIDLAKEGRLWSPKN